METITPIKTEIQVDWIVFHEGTCFIQGSQLAFLPKFDLILLLDQEVLADSGKSLTYTAPGIYIFFYILQCAQRSAHTRYWAVVNDCAGLGRGEWSPSMTAKSACLAICGATCLSTGTEAFLKSPNMVHFRPRSNGCGVSENTLRVCSGNAKISSLNIASLDFYNVCDILSLRSWSKDVIKMLVRSFPRLELQVWVSCPVGHHCRVHNESLPGKKLASYYCRLIYHQIWLQIS